MMEYRVQVNNDGEWKFIKDRHGKFYTYTSLINANKYGFQKANSFLWGKHLSNPRDHVRVVAADIYWYPV